MSFSGSTVEQRDKEEKALRSFLWLYLIGSVVLHLLAVAVGVMVPWNRVLAPKEEPIEVTMVEPLPQEAPKLKEEPTDPSPQPTTPLRQPKITDPPPEKVQERQQSPTENRPVEKAVNPRVSPPANPRTRSDQPATTAGESQASPGVNPFAGLSGSEGGSSGQSGGGGAETLTGAGAGAVGSGQGTGTGTGAGNGSGTGSGSGSGTGSGQGTGGAIGFGTGTGQGTGTGTGTGSGSGTGSGEGTGTGTGSGSGTAGSRGASTGILVDKNASLDGIRQEATAVVRNGKVVDFKFQSTGDPELDKQIRRQLDRYKKKLRLPSGVTKDGEVRANINFNQAKDSSGKTLKRSRQAEQYLERQATERRRQTAASQSSSSTTSSVIQRGVNVPASTRTRTRSSPSTPTPVRKTRVRKTQSSYTPSVQSTPSTSTSERRTRVRVRKVPSTSTPQQSPSTSTPSNSTSGSE